MRKTALAFVLALIVSAVGCVIRTEHKIDAHITLDIRHIQEQAQAVLDYTEGKTDALPGMGEPAATSWLDRGLDLLNPMPVAYAAELKSVSPLVTEIATSLRGRNDAVNALKKQGCLGENNRGYVELRDCDGLADAEKKNTAQQLLAEENKDRKALHNEVARLNEDQGVSVSAVESVYALERLKRAGAGEIVQLPSAGTEFDGVKASPLGQKLADKCQPGAWVNIP